MLEKFLIIKTDIVYYLHKFCTGIKTINPDISYYNSSIIIPTLL